MCVGGGGDVVVIEVTACCQSVCSIVRQCKLSGSSKNYFIKLVCSVCKVLFVLAFLASFSSFCLDTRQCNFAAAATNLGQRKEVDCWGKKEKRRRRYLGRIYALLHGEHFIKTHMRENANAKKNMPPEMFHIASAACCTGEREGANADFFSPSFRQTMAFSSLCAPSKASSGGRGGGGSAAATAEEGYKTKMFRSREKSAKILFFLAFFPGCANIR